jgi:hypothetical protein
MIYFLVMAYVYLREKEEEQNQNKASLAKVIQPISTKAFLIII